MARDVIDIGAYLPSSERERRMRDAEALYSMDPVRGRLVPKLIELIEATRADRCALFWCDPPGGPVPHIVIDSAKDSPRLGFGAGLMAGLESTTSTRI